MSYRQQQEQDEAEQKICDALARVTLGLGGRAEAEILAEALGQRFATVNASERVTHEV